MTPQEKMSALWQRIPRRLFGGRMRTTTVVMCLLWLGLAMLNAQLNEESGTATNPGRAGVERSEQHQPAVVDPSTQTSTSSTPSETSSSSVPPSSSSESSRPSGQSATTTVPDVGGTTTTERTTDRQPTTTSGSVEQSQAPAGTSSATESTTNPSPGG